MNREKQTWDVVIIGAGAAGLLASASAASRNKSTLLLEKNRKLGVKILMSGGTRCNITHNCSAREIANRFEQHGNNGRFLLSALSAFPPEKVLELLHLNGVKTKVESTGKIFPVSNRAIDVRDALVRIAKNSGVTIRNETSVINCNKSDQLFQIQTDQEIFMAKKLVITSGGKSYPGCGTTGDGYPWAEQFGHSITPLGAALTPIVSQVPWANELKGIVATDSVIQVHDTTSNKIISSCDQPILFTHFGFSGPGPMNVSRAISLAPKSSLRLLIDFCPSMNEEKLFEDIIDRCNSGVIEVAGQLLRTDWPKRLREALLNSFEFNSRERVAELSKKRFRHLARSIKRTAFPIHGTRGYRKAEVTAGGVSLNDVNSSTMQSKLVDGLFFAGEILDLDGPIGGFNFQSAFSTGWLAGQNV